MTKRILSLLVALTICLSMLPAVPVMAADIASGEGWNLDSNGCLHLTGEIHNPSTWNSDQTPWRDFKSKIKTVKADSPSIDNCALLFASCSSLTKVELYGTDTWGVTSTYGMFKDCYRLTSVDFDLISVRSVTNMAYTFANCYALKEVKLPSTNNTNLTNLAAMFYNCQSLTSVDFTWFTVPCVKNMNSMFYGCEKLQTVDLSHLTTRNVETMEQMFWGCTSLTELDLSSFDTSNVESMCRMFLYCDNLRTLDISSFKTRSDGIYTFMFTDVFPLYRLRINHDMLQQTAGQLIKAHDRWIVEETGKVCTTEEMLKNLTGTVTLRDASGDKTDWYVDEGGCLHITGAIINPSTNEYDYSPWKEHKPYIKSVVAESGSSIDNGAFLFFDCFALETANLKKLDTSKVTSMVSMFGLTSLKKLDLSGWNTSNVTSMKAMFAISPFLTSVNMSGCKTTKVTDMGTMFAFCPVLSALNLGDFTVSASTNTEYMVNYAPYLAEITASPSLLAGISTQLLEISSPWYNRANGTAYTTADELKAISGKVTLSTLPFKDVSSGDYFFDPVVWAVAQGITQGTSATAFSPSKPCTRGQVVTFLWRAAGEPSPSITDNPFTDVKPSDYYYKAVLWAVENDITKGTSNTTFGPSKPCTRGQVVTFLYRAHGNPVIYGACTFTDVKESDYFYNAVRWAFKNGIANGTSKTEFSPGEDCTRGQIVTFLYRDYNR